MNKNINTMAGKTSNGMKKIFSIKLIPSIAIFLSVPIAAFAIVLPPDSAPSVESPFGGTPSYNDPANVELRNAQPVNTTVQQPVKETPQQPVKVATQQITATFQNPLGGVNSLSDLFYKIVNFIIGLSYVVIAAFYLLAGFKFVKAQGNPEELSSAKRAFFNTTIGAVIIVGINVITQVIKSIIEGLQS